MNNLNVEKLQKNLSAYLYKYFDGSDSELPEDEYDSEAMMLAQFLVSYDGEIDARQITRKLRSILLEMFDHDYGEDALLDAGEDISKLLHR